MDRIAAAVTCADGEVLQVFAQLPHALRVASRRGLFLVRGEDVFRLGTTPTEPAVAAPPEERPRLLAVRTLLDAASFGPLHRATGCRRLAGAPPQFELQQPTGAPWRVELRPDTLLPAALHCGDQKVVVLDYLRTSSTWMVQRAESAALGACSITFEIADLAWDTDFFTVPAASAATPAPPPPPAMPFVPGGTEPKSATPFLKDTAAVEWVLIDDPGLDAEGSWAARAAAYTPVYHELERQNQAIPGFPILTTIGDRRVLAAPFRRRDGGARLQPPAGWRVHAVPAGRQLVVYPAAGDFAARVAAGERLLRETLAGQALQARGPLLVQPFFHLEEGVPPADKLAAPVVRMSLPVQ